MSKRTLVCARATAPFAPTGAVFNRFCFECGERVMIAPSGQGFLREHPDTRILCDRCYHGAGGRPDDKHWLPASPEVMAAEVASAIPNPWRQRN